MKVIEERLANMAYDDFCLHHRVPLDNGGFADLYDEARTGTQTSRAFQREFAVALRRRCEDVGVLLYDEGSRRMYAGESAVRVVASRVAYVDHAQRLKLIDDAAPKQEDQFTAFDAEIPRIERYTEYAQLAYERLLEARQWKASEAQHLSPTQIKARLYVVEGVVKNEMHGRGVLWEHADGLASLAENLEVWLQGSNLGYKESDNEAGTAEMYTLLSLACKYNAMYEFLEDHDARRFRSTVRKMARIARVSRMLLEWRSRYADSGPVEKRCSYSPSNLHHISELTVLCLPNDIRDGAFQQYVHETVEGVDESDHIESDLDAARSWFGGTLLSPEERANREWLANRPVDFR